MRGATLWLILLVACGQGPLDPPLAQVFATPFSSAAAPSVPDDAVAPLPQHVEVDPAKANLGRRLFVDLRVSGDGQVSCSSCHSLEHGGAIPHKRTDLPSRNPVPVNVPSVFNAAFNARFAWNGRFTDIGEQLDFAINSPAAMRGSWERAAYTLKQDAALSAEFAVIYPGGLSAGAVREVLALYCLSLVTPNARFDRYLRAELQLSAAEEHGYRLFREYGCISCHQGINFGGNLLQRFGVVSDYFAERGTGSPSDNGLYELTHDPDDLHVFRVPSLRNVALTAPYFHDGSAADLPSAVRDMARFQLGRILDPQETGFIVGFLGTLSGEVL